MLKSETRKIAKKLELNVADKPDSQDICFVPNGDYVSVIKKYKPDSYKKGNIRDVNGNVIGVHEGIINFTIGQRKGIKISNKNPLYVIKIDAEKNEIIVGTKEKLIKKKIELKNINLLSDKLEFENDILVKVRSTGKLIKAKVEIENNTALVNLKEEEYGISAGQACVFYLENSYGFKVLGGGWIVN
jgi:tRNA-specific 2-thiouridylase